MSRTLFTWAGGEMIFEMTEDYGFQGYNHDDGSSGFSMTLDDVPLLLKWLEFEYDRIMKNRPKETSQKENNGKPATR